MRSVASGALALLRAPGGVKGQRPGGVEAPEGLG